MHVSDSPPYDRVVVGRRLSAYRRRRRRYAAQHWTGRSAAPDSGTSFNDFPQIQ
ncbi:hypothetical protein GTP91_29125 [Rugamonas sp. FT82W]|uniref:Uncharacterized protein n=1 Tax=Duganella vulcania TaxID=2692166 RepID=A0A845GCW5_9BURK|nr:hypothetical protein [Duganella vulcania]MYM91225.1 hypothetical protein [Duganella vulcania]